MFVKKLVKLAKKESYKSLLMFVKMIVKFGQKVSHKSLLMFVKKFVKFGQKVSQKCLLFNVCHKVSQVWSPSRSKFLAMFIKTFSVINFATILLQLIYCLPG